MVGPSTDNHLALTHRLKTYVRTVIESEALHYVIRLRGTIAINRDWVYNEACRLSHDIQVISNIFIAFDNIFELIT